MNKHRCKYCRREMNVSSLEYKSNSYCNICFDERARTSIGCKVVAEEVFVYNNISVTL